MSIHMEQSEKSLRHIVGVQFRNCATIGGSIWGRYGFSDVLTMFLAMDTWWNCMMQEEFH